MRVAGVIVAAGRSERLGGEVPKQYQSLGGRAVLAHAADALLAHPAVDVVQVVIHPDHRPLYDAATAGLDPARLRPPVPGGESRSASVHAGLRALAPEPPEHVLIHDAARPLLPAQVITDVLAALETASAAIPALPVVDALWREADGHADAPAARDGLWRAQTPQGFRFPAILAAYDSGAPEAADDAAVARAAGLDVRLVAGDEANFKITTAADLARARSMAGNGMDIRTGNGFDVHRFAPGDRMMLCGVEVPADRALAGHSDADVGLHAITDAVFGALAEGDIGRWFPPTDPVWEGAASARFLARAVERAAARGYVVSHLDCTLVCEQPKIAPHAAAMRAAVAGIAGIDVGRVSVKATTSEGLGFTGRGEGIAAFATATLIRR